jgi:phenylpropionate dioxygenase-like ring-hydroxylating dioxygenase large terminal subunit
MAERVPVLDDWPVQATRGHPIPGERYTSRAFMEQEWAGVWSRVWLLLGREAELPEPGDWQLEALGSEEILMVRQADGTVKAFLNVCQHRGNPLVSEPRGSIKRRFVCRYHSWAWLPDGTLDFVPDRADFPQGDPCGKLRLPELRCETFAGFVWVNLDPDCTSLEEYLGPIHREWAAREFDGWRRTMANSMWLPCNWKVVLDNFNESYHVPTVHMAATPDTDRTRIHGAINTHYRETKFDLSEAGHNRMVMQGGFGVGATDAEGNLRGPIIGQLRYWGLDPDDFRGEPERTRIALQQAKRRLGPERGFTHYANVPDEQLTDAFHYTLFPNFAVSVWSDGFHFLRARPHPTDPEQCLFDNWWYASPAAIAAGPEAGERGMGEPLISGEVPVRMLVHGEDSIGPAIEEDVAVFVTQQRGFRSRGYRGAYLAGQERRISRLHELVDEWIAGAGA